MNTSRTCGKTNARNHVSFNVDKSDSNTMRFVTVLVPNQVQGGSENTAIEAEITAADGTNLSVRVKIGSESYRTLGYTL